MLCGEAEICRICILFFAEALARGSKRKFEQHGAELVIHIGADSPALAGFSIAI